MRPAFQVAACFASSTDGKLTAPAEPNTWVKLGTAADLERLFRLRDAHDALLFGGNTFRSWMGIRWGWEHRQSPKASPPPLHVLLTQGWQLDWQHPLFEEWQQGWETQGWSPFFVASPTPPPAGIPACVAWLPLDSPDNWQPIASKLESLGCQGLLVEGGGEVLAVALQQGWIQTLHLTLTPWLIGGHVASLLGGEGFPLSQAPQVHWQSIAPQASGEIFLSGEIRYAESLP